MALARWQATIVDNKGNVQPSAYVEVRLESTGALATLYSDRDGLVITGNPIVADSETGYAYFHVAGGAYKITAFKNGFQRVWRYVGIGRASETDSGSGRTKSTAATTIYVRKDGTGSANGATDDTGAFLTIQQAIDYAKQNVDAGGFGYIIEARTGVFAKYRASFSLVGDFGLSIKGRDHIAITGTSSGTGGVVRCALASSIADKLVTGDRIQVYGVVGTTEANISATNKTWTVTVINSTTIELQGSVYANAWVSGGWIVMTILEAAANGDKLGWHEDHATVLVYNIGVTDGGFTSVVGFYGRQYSITDLIDPVYGFLASGIHVQLDENACGGESGTPRLVGSASANVRLRANSRFGISATRYVGGGLTVTTVKDVDEDSTLMAAAQVVYTGPGIPGGASPLTGRKYDVIDGSIRSSIIHATWPGNTDGRFFRLFGPGAAVTDNAAVRWDGATGNVQQGSAFVIDDTGHVTSFGGKITFPATDAGSGANTLGDYEQGTWTPVITFATPGNLAVAYLLQSADYTKIGREVRVSFITFTSSFTHTTASGALRITGLPFTSAATTHNHVGSSFFQGITKAGYTQVNVQVAGGVSRLNFTASASAAAVSTVVAADVPTGGTVDLEGTNTYPI